jgi:hypothetical protein
MRSKGEMRVRVTKGIAAAGLAAALWAGIAAGPAVAGKKLVYRDPASYRGIHKAPRTKAPPKPPLVTLSSTGQHPDLLVDEAGTAHIVWNEPRGDQADATMYCRLKRGARSCDVLKTLLWNKSYGPGDGPQFNIDWHGPKVVRIGEQLVVLSKRFPTSPSRVVAWTSNDGGNTWSTPEAVGRIDLGQVVVFGPPDDPTILDGSIEPYCSGPGGMCVQAFKSGQYTSAYGVLGEPNENYYPSLTVVGGLPLASFADLSNKVILRRWTGAGSPIDPKKWTPPVKIAGVDEPEVASGSGRTWLLDRNPSTRAERVRRLTVAGSSISADSPSLSGPQETTTSDGSRSTLAAGSTSSGGGTTTARVAAKACTSPSRPPEASESRRS